MDKVTKLTLDELMRRKEHMLETKKTRKKKELYIESLDASITITAPDRTMVTDTLGMPDYDKAAYLAYECVTEPSMKKAAKEFGCDIPMNVVDIVFEPGEVEQISTFALELAGYKEGKVKPVEEVKN